MKSGFSRLPVYHGDNYQHVVGVLLVKTLIVINPQSKLTVADVAWREPLIVSPNYRLLEMLALFRKGYCHLAFISNDALTARNNLRMGLPQDNRSEFIGIVTLEDLVEEILQDEIVDETDCNPDLEIFGTSRSRVLHNGVVKLRSNHSPLLTPRAKAKSNFLDLERSLTHFVAHNPEGALLFAPPVSLMKSPPSKYSEMVKIPISLSIPKTVSDIVDNGEKVREDNTREGW